MRPSASKFMIRSPSRETSAHGTAVHRGGAREQRPRRQHLGFRARRGPHRRLHDGRVGRGSGPRVEDVVQVRTPRASQRRRAGERARTQSQRGRRLARRSRVLDADVDRRRLTHDAQVAAGAHERPGQPFAHRCLGCEVGGPSLRDPAEVQAHAGGEQDLAGAHVDLAPAPARLRRMQRATSAGEHFVEVAVVPGRDHRVEHRRIEQPVGALGLCQREADQRLERRRHRRPSTGRQVHAAELAVVAEA